MERLQPFWLQGRAGDHDVVLSTRLRLARNLYNWPFPARLKRPQRQQIQEHLERAASNEFPHWRCLRAELLEPALRELLFEKHLISSQLKDHPQEASICLSTEARFSLMFNEEDHLRIQLLLPGWQITDSWQELLRVERRLSNWVDFAFDSQYGYLTSCHSNVGTGLRVSSMLALPALNWDGQLGHRLQDWHDRAIEFRGAFGEGSSIQASLVQISNRFTLGQNCAELSLRVQENVERLVSMEREARQRLFREQRALVEDRVFRALGILKGARILDSREAAGLLASVRLGACLGLIQRFSPGELLRLLVASRPAHLHLQFPSNERENLKRSRVLRLRLGELRV